jgi:hypothetical protein
MIRNPWGFAIGEALMLSATGITASVFSVELLLVKDELLVGLTLVGPPMVIGMGMTAAGLEPSQR